MLAGLIVTVAKPLISLNSTIISLTDAVKVLEKNLDAISGKNSQQHEKLWTHEKDQDETLKAHEMRLRLIESGGEKSAGAKKCRRHEAGG